METSQDGLSGAECVALGRMQLEAYNTGDEEGERGVKRKKRAMSRREVLAKVQEEAELEEGSRRRVGRPGVFNDFPHGLVL